MKKIMLIATISVSALLTACGGDTEKTTDTKGEAPKSMVSDPQTYDPKRGEGKWTAESLALKEQLDETWIASGESISGVKCTSCHKMTDEKLVGPGWKGVTQRRTPEWIMNFITNPDPMIDKDPEAQAMLELCLVRMPNQSLSDTEARNILEYMRKLDSTK
ncbi:MAG: cytochrome c [Bacteroidia bacterium]|nr:cytochrome c [Bacteroidia bacterium]